MLLSELFSLLMLLLVIPAAVKDAKQALLPKMKMERGFQHLTFATVFALGLLWSAQAGIKADLNIHFLALTTITMMYGWRVAFLLSIPASMIKALLGNLDWSALPEYLLISALIPILLTYLIFLASYRWLPRNIFVFIFVAGFFNGGVTGTCHLLLNAAYLLLLGSHDWATIYDNYLIFLPLLAFPEGLLNGMALAMLCVFKPEWLRTFSDRDYLYNHHHNDRR
ncbi:energy-coupling factor ABC transporter permease [Vibrio sp.]|uniref:energy-coupling factor ABC transporter permease n=1 Tax=Vibrio sp. TaxID=678 RepID=UPI003D0F992C